MTKTRVLIIDDEPDIRELLSLTLQRMHIESDTAKNIDEAKRNLEKKNYSICLTDMKLPDGNGIDLVKYAQLAYPEMPIAVITAHGSMDVAIEAMKAGAFDFVTKPIDLSSLRKIISTAVTSSQLTKTEKHDDGIIGKSESVQKLRSAISKLARSQAPVYISGESGSGKELVAKAIHELGPRKSNPFIPVNCGAIPKELMESEFFGHKKGTFTGAAQDKIGLFQAADGGTLFLDEVADLPLDMQVKLLRAIQEKAIRPVGAQNEISIDVRILSATHRNLKELVKEGDFRQDLFYRLNVIQLQVPALRERKSDIILLVKHFLKKLEGNNQESPTTLSDSALTQLKHYNFPGNIRELENILERAYTLCENSVIEPEDLQLSTVEKEISVSQIMKAQGHYANCRNYDSIDDYIAEVEKEILSDALEHVRWNKTLAAKKLGISFRSFRYRLSKLGLSDDIVDGE